MSDESGKEFLLRKKKEVINWLRKLTLVQQMIGMIVISTLIVITIDIFFI